MIKTAKTVKGFIAQISRDFGDITFQKGSSEHWSPRTNTITYDPNQPLHDLRYGVLHELAHAKLNHTNYGSDFELLRLESMAWDEAAQIGRRYGISISSSHIQSCLDTYRDWLHRRSACPKCGTHGLQKAPRHYQCFNCRNIWRVSSGRFVRPYRRTHGVTAV